MSNQDRIGCRHTGIPQLSSLTSEKSSSLLTRDAGEVDEVNARGKSKRVVEGLSTRHVTWMRTREEGA